MEATPRLTLVHDWLTGMRGGEKCLEIICRRWPSAALYTLLHREGSVSEAIERLGPRCSPLQLLPAVHRYYRYLLPIMPWAAGRWRLPECDLVVSFSHCVAKSVHAPQGVPHICYCFTPMRYAWHMRDAYFSARPSLKRTLTEALLRELRDWDRRTAAGVTHFVAISKTVQQRIAECYGRDSRVIYPPVDTDFYHPAELPREDFYLAVSALAPYKRIDLAVEACRQLGRRLIVIGSGQQEKRLRQLGDVQFLGWQPDSVIRDHLQRCRALLFPGEEDFGIVPLEAHACGAAVIAYGRGGATETVVPLDGPGYNEPTGVWFAEQSVECLVGAMELFEKRADEFCPDAARRQAVRFDSGRYEAEMVSLFGSAINNQQEASHLSVVEPVTTARN